MTGLLVGSAIAAGVSALAPLLLARRLRRWGAVDVPNDRSSHSAPAVRGLGVGVLAGVGAGLGASAVAGAAVTPVLAVALAAGAAAGVLGFVEDVRGVPAGVRAGAQAVIGAGVTAAVLAMTVGFDALAIPLVALGAFVFVAYVNIVNFMDGVDGISALHALVIGAFFIACGLIWDAPELLMLGSLLAAAFLGFLPWNLAVRGYFLGDVGSYLLGGGIASGVIVAVAAGVPAVAIVSPLAIYLADTGFTLLRRMANAEPWHLAHRSHVYQRLTDTGLRHPAIAVLVATASALCGLAGIGIALSPPIIAGGLWVALVALVVTYLRLPALRGWSRETPAWLEPPASVPSRPIPEGMPLRIAVVGASGFVGSGIAAAARERGHIVHEVAAPRLSIGAAQTTEALQAQARLLATASAELRDSLTADIVVNAAGLATPDGVSDDALHGANALLPAVLLLASSSAGAARFIHLSSAAVQGRSPRLDESARTAPFSAYSRSKAAGETLLLSLVEQGDAIGCETVIVRATSVQGAGRSTTESLRRVARSRLSSVAGTGESPSAVSSLEGLSSFVCALAEHQGDLPTVVLQPSEGVTAADVLRAAGGREPLRLPVLLCRALVAGGYIAAAFLPRLTGAVRRVEVMWFGQEVDDRWARSQGSTGIDRVTPLLDGGVRP
jgi:UDP-N-acetylmuramyl pentapeptide phosphotransferase/UDP-N-acetylglucosamine-1-phosphate transferase/nucleoside-diphosphate-sugar epimerase